MATTDDPLMKPPSAETQRKINRWAARIIPLILIGAVGYATWVVVVLLCVKYLLDPPTDVPKRTAAGIVTLTIYSILLLFLAISYFRTFHVVLTNPGLVPVQAAPEEKEVGSNEYLDRGSVSGGRTSPPGGLGAFYNRELFECEVDGLPRWCSTCKVWKPDRSHHCSEIGRCVYKMDHYCPWVGGIVSETAFKFFIQFCFYTLLYCIFVLVVMAYFFAQRHSEINSYDANWAVAIGLASFFGLFSSGMVVTSAYFAFTNLSTVENLARRTRTYNFAVLIPSSSSSSTMPYQTITYPLTPPSEAAQEQRLPMGQQRTFAILHVAKGQNPYALKASENFKEVMGLHIWDWFLPMKYSPCCAHGAQGDAETGLGAPSRSMYRMGPVFEKLKADAALPHSGPLREKTAEMV